MKLNEIIQLWEINNPDKANLFDGMNLPKLFTQEYLYNLIVLEYGDMEVLYNNSKVFYTSVSLFWDKNSSVFDRLEETTKFSYDPLTDHSYRSSKDSSGDRDENNNGEQQNFVNAFNQNTSDSPKSRNTYNDNGHNDWTYKDKTTHDGIRDHTYQELIKQERDVINYHVEDIILKLWAEEIMISLW